MLEVLTHSLIHSLILTHPPAPERCHLPGRVLSSIYDGVRHYQLFGYWSSEGMSVEKIKMKYKIEAIRVLIYYFT